MLEFTFKIKVVLV